MLILKNTPYFKFKRQHEASARGTGEPREAGAASAALRWPADGRRRDWMKKKFERRAAIICDVLVCGRAKREYGSPFCRPHKAREATA